MRICEICKKELKDSQRRACSRTCSAKLNTKIRKRTRLTNGYREIYHQDHNRKNKYVREHILVMSKHLGREVKYPENVHHIDGDKLNNSIDNLYLFPNVAEHSKLHKQMERLVQQMYKDGFVEFKDCEYKLKEEAVAYFWLSLHKLDKQTTK